MGVAVDRGGVLVSVGVASGPPDGEVPAFGQSSVGLARRCLSITGRLRNSFKRHGVVGSLRINLGQRLRK